MLSSLIDECLSPTLCDEARARGYHAMHVNHLKMNAHRDQVLAAYAIAADHVLVTNNGVDYRPIYRAMDIHPGLVIIIRTCGDQDRFMHSERFSTRSRQHATLSID